jgi:hypothetical protein
MPLNNKSSNSFSVNITERTLLQLTENYKEESQTTVLCNYISKQKYINGGWVNIYPTTYLVNKNQTLPLLHAQNIPLAPNRHVFKKAGELKQFILLFPAVPIDWEYFSVIEKCIDANGFVVSNIKRNKTGLYEISIH